MRIRLTKQQNVFYGWAVFSLFCSVSEVAHAEGPINLGAGAQGANRRVRTNNGFVGVQGTFSEPSDFNVPAQYDPTNREYIAGSNAQQSKPSFYLGSGSGDREIDAGLQWEYQTVGTGAAMIEPGWSAFISWSHAGDISVPPDGRPDRYTNPVVGGREWRIPRGDLNDVTLTSRVLDNGGTNLRVQNGPTDFNFHWHQDRRDNGTQSTAVYPVTAAGRITNNAVAGMNVKRVVALTQTAAPTLDDSYMRDVLFTGGDIAPNTRDAAGNFTYPWAGTWPANSVDQDETGYSPGDASSGGNFVFRGINGQRQWIIDFSFAGMGTPVAPGTAGDPYGTYRDAENANRYPRERVHISLRNGPAAVRGQRARR